MTLLILLHLPLQADPTPFRAVYKAKYQGVPISVQGVRELKEAESGEYVFSSTAKALIASFSETVTFKVIDAAPVPQRYQYARTGFGRNKSFDLAFDWQASTVTRTAKDSSASLALRGPAWDKLSYQYKMREDLAAAQASGAPWPEMRYQVVDDGQLKEYVFAVTGEETINTPLGDLRTIKAERVRDHNRRSTTFWMAPDYEFLLVQFIQDESNGKGFSLLLKSAEFGGKAVTGIAAAAD